MFLKKSNPDTDSIGIINRTAIIVRPKQPFITWHNRVTGDNKKNIHFKNCSSTYLFTTEISVDVAMEKVEAEYEFIFGHFLLQSTDNMENWPQEISVDMLKR